MSQKMHLQSGMQAVCWPVVAGRWALGEGYHPYISRMLPALAKVPLFPSEEECELLRGRELPVALETFGHHTVVDSGFLTAAEKEGSPRQDEYALAPLFVRDLCGRLVHTGLMPMLAPPDVPLFPAGCRHVPEENAELIENALFFTYRRLEFSARTQTLMAGENDLYLRAMYAKPNSYSYKLRPDTFYADGWRVPQVCRVFAMAGTPVQAQQATQEFLQRWQQRPEGQSYEQFYDANEGDEWYPQLFAKGCTIIPTVEAYNGRYHIADNYMATEVDPGRVVDGLHQVVSSRASALPKDTILEVIEPGWVTATSIQPAKVVISDGSEWVEPTAPEPQLPNLAWPHPRVSPVWGDVWLPTHPQHFAEPALWDWDANGHFIQVKGPLWDPLHYVYTSTQPLLRAHRRRLEGTIGLFSLPDSIKNQFHPVMEQTWFDSLNERTAQQRSEDVMHPLYGSAIDQVPLMKTVATIGYHPLPLGLEYELDPAHFPNRHPAHRVKACPAHLQDRVVSLAQLKVAEEDLAKLNVVLSEGFRAGLAEAQQAPNRDDFTILGNGQSVSVTKILPAWLPELGQSRLMINIKRLFANKSYREQLQKTAAQWEVPTLPTELYQFREAALAWRRLRYRLFVKYPAVWQKAYSEGLDLATVEPQTAVIDVSRHETVRAGRKNLLGVKALPAEMAGGLPSSGTPGKLGKKTKTPNSR